MLPALSFLALTVLAVDPAPASHCAPFEVTAFTCTIDKSKKIVSLCASKDAGPKTGYVQYRFGKKDKVELTFPEDKSPASQHFQGFSQRYTKGGASSLRFHHGDVDYLVYTGGTMDWMWSGVAVFKGDQKQALLECDDDNLSIDDDWIKSLALPKDIKVFSPPGS